MSLPDAPPAALPTGAPVSGGPGGATPSPEMRRATRLLWIGGGLLAAGIVFGIVGFVVAIARSTAAEGDIGYVMVPGYGAGTLEEGTYIIRDGSTFGAAWLEVPDITVYSPDGDEVPVTFTTGSSGTNLATFTVTTAGRHEVVTEIPPRVDEWDVVGSVWVARDSSELSAAFLGWFLAGFLGGGGLCVAGVIVCIVGAVRRNRARPTPPPTPFGYAGYGRPGGYGGSVVPGPYGAPGWGPPPGGGWGAPAAPPGPPPPWTAPGQVPGPPPVAPGAPAWPTAPPPAEGPAADDGASGPSPPPPPPPA